MTTVDHSPENRADSSARFVTDCLRKISITVVCRQEVDGAIRTLDTIIGGRTFRILEIRKDAHSKLTFKFPPLTSIGVFYLKETTPEFSLLRVARVLLARYNTLKS